MNLIKANFSRKTPESFAKVIGIPMGWFVISHVWIPDKKFRRSVHAKWFKLKSPHGQIYRILRCSASLEASKENGTGTIVLDWPGWLDLYDRAEDVDAPLEIEISPAKWWHTPYLATSHPDPTMQLAGRISLISLGLGMLSIILSLILSLAP